MVILYGRNNKGKIMDEEKNIPHHYYNSDNREIVDMIGIIHDLFKDYCEDRNKSSIYNEKYEYSDEKFKDFLAYLEIDIYDWVKCNLHTFYRDKYKDTVEE
jgi:hypothetical protein